MEGTFPDPHGGGQRGKPVGVCNRHLCMSFSHVDHRPQGTDAPSSGEAGSGRGAAVALGLCLGWGAAPRYLHGPHDQAAAPPQPTLAPARGGGQFTPFRKAGQLLGFLATAGAGWGSARASPAGRWLGVGGASARRLQTRPGCGPAWLSLCCGHLRAHTCPGLQWRGGLCPVLGWQPWTSPAHGPLPEPLTPGPH